MPEQLNVAHADNNIFRLSQKHSLPGQAHARRRVGRATRRDAGGARRRRGRLDVEPAVKRAYCDLWLAHQRARGLRARQRVLAERFAQTAEQRYAVGERPAGRRAARAGRADARAITEAQTGALAIDTARAELNALLSRPPDEPLGDAGGPRLPELAAERRRR